MKHIKLKLIFILTIFSYAVNAQQGDPVPQVAQLPQHPRLFLPKGAEKPLMKRVNKDAYWKQLHNELVAESDRMMTMTPSDRVVIGKRLLNVSRESIRRIFFLSYAYRATGDKKYAERAEKEMLHIANFSDWNPVHFLDVAEMTLAFAIGYDWCFDFLSDNSKAIIKSAIIEKGLKPSLDKKNNYWLRVTNNWNQVCNASAAVGAIAVYEDIPEMATEIINRSVNSIPLSMNEYGPDGAYPEGIGYWIYGTSFNVLLIDALEKAYNSDFGLSKIPGFMPSGLYSQQMITPSGAGFAYADVGTKGGELNSTVFWFYGKTLDPSLLYMQKKSFETDKNKKFLRERLMPTAIIYGAGAGASLANPAEPKELMWVGNGVTPVAVMRSSWSAPDAIYLGFKSGTPSSNHGHMDIGSFFVESEGVKWALDMGMENYTVAEKAGVDLWNKTQESGRWDVYRYNNLVHNTITINNRYQRVDEKADIKVLSTEPNNMSVSSDITKVVSPSIKKAVRKVSLVNKEDVVIIDTVLTDKFFAKLRWNMMTEADKITALDDTTIELQKNGITRYLKLVSPVKMKFYKTAATPVNSGDSPNPGITAIGWEAELPLGAESVIEVTLSKEKPKSK